MNYSLQMNLKTVEINVLIYEIVPSHFLSAPGLAWQACLKKAGVKLELLTDIDVLLMVEKGIRGGICHAIHRYAKANNKYLKNYDKSIELSYFMYLHANNLYGWGMSQKLPVNGFKWIKNVFRFYRYFTKNYDKNGNKRDILEVDVEYSKNFHDLHRDLPFLGERKKIKKYK